MKWRKTKKYLKKKGVRIPSLKPEKNEDIQTFNNKKEIYNLNISEYLNGVLTQKSIFKGSYYLKKLGMEVENYYDHGIYLLNMKSDVYHEQISQIASMPVVINKTLFTDYAANLEEKINNYNLLIKNHQEKMLNLKIDGLKEF